MENLYTSRKAFLQQATRFAAGGSRLSVAGCGRRRRAGAQGGSGHGSKLQLDGAPCPGELGGKLSKPAGS